MDTDRYQKAFLSMKSCLNIYRLIMVVGITATSKHHHVERSHTEVRHILSLHFHPSSSGLWRDFSFIKGIFILLMMDLGLRKHQSSSVKHVFPQVFPEVWFWSQFYIRLLFIRREFTVSVRIRQPAKTIISLDDAQQTRHSTLKSF